MNIDPAVAIALSVESHKGIYALLLGSGISKAAGIPTGWDIVKDLVRRLALLEGEKAEDPEIWYRSKFEKPPNYSEIIEKVAQTAPERASLLKEYFELTEKEREDGLKVPTQAHKEIARLVARGYIRVIITTNFDRLLERALEQEGISPTVVSSSDHIQGMMPLPHARCLLFKLHGDYLDTRIKNTPEELTQYDDPTKELLDRILTEYGLIICGWSGEWDIALADAILRNTRYRFSTYWMAYGSLAPRATDIISHRQATVLNISSANEAFNDLALKVEALESQRLAEPISPRLAIAMMKKYLEGYQHPVQPQDFVIKKLQRVKNNLDPQHFPLHEGPEEAAYHQRLERLEALIANLVPIVMTGVYWGEEKHDQLCQRCIEALARRELWTGGATSHTAWSALQYYPATLVLYAAGIAAISKGRYRLLKLLLEDSTGKDFFQKEFNDEYPIWQILNARNCFPQEPGVFLPEGKNRTAGSDRIAKQLRPLVSEVCGEDDEFDNLFDEFELIMALVYADRSRNQFIPMGRFARRSWSFRENNRTPFARMKIAISEKQTKHPLLVAGMFGGKIGRLTTALDQAWGFALQGIGAW